MKKVLLLGDDICAQYRERVKELLADICEIVHPDINAGYTAAALWFIREQHDVKYHWDELDLIHWNTGVWDHHRTLNDGLPLVSEELYLWFNRRFQRQLACYSANLIFATTTPAGDGYKYDPKGIYGIPKDEWNREIALYNDIITPYFESEGVVINDLHALVAANPEYLSEDGIHLSDMGIQAAAVQTANAIRMQLRKAEAENTNNGAVSTKRRGKDETCSITW